MLLLDRLSDLCSVYLLSSEFHLRISLMLCLECTYTKVYYSAVFSKMYLWIFRRGVFGHRPGSGMVPAVAQALPGVLYSADTCHVITRCLA